ncbi:glycosidase [Mucilaginibacter sp. HC2]|uniref:glycoside hydrolase family 130 protein n=1 Tax=Mucilaginibacter TaxID=423349 RepID=UPI000DCC4C9D|nr:MULTISPECIES: glycosidase [Mucilaginibacter]NHA05544.1 glycosidase [Mucilaginibacter inviolabilis]QTE35353.1 glycosidase [Mucilaginibacter gossypii]RAV59446.1 glycosidase [Mucilaginibacter rubeus]
MSAFKLRRLGTIMVPEPGNDMEIGGVLNPAAVRGPDGALYLFPRLVAKGNYSRIGIARVKFDKKGDPCGVDRLGIALEPEEDYEKRPGGGGCEDPRITFVETLGRYMMTYTAFSADGPRIALAQSTDLIRWERLGLAKFLPYKKIRFNGIDNKDACIFPMGVLSKHNHLSMAMLHRPLFPGTRPEDTMLKSINRRIGDHHECIWISYCHIKMDPAKPRHLARFESNQPLAIPSAPWESLKIGAGTPPVLTPLGWLILYHGVSDMRPTKDDAHELRYAAGLMILDKEHPERILYRSPSPVLSPDLPEEQVGVIANVVFPTGIDRRDDLGQPQRFDVYYGMADNRIGVARLDIPDRLPGKME